MYASLFTKQKQKSKVSKYTKFKLQRKRKKKKDGKMKQNKRSSLVQKINHEKNEHLLFRERRLKIKLGIFDLERQNFLIMKKKKLPLLRRLGIKNRVIQQNAGHGCNLVPFKAPLY